jgi:hypothetical protein
MSLHIKQVTSTEYKKTGDNTMYPNTPVYIVEVKDKQTGTTYVNHHMSIPEFNLIKKLQFLFNTKALSRQAVAEMLQLINSHTEEERRQADFDANYDG